MPIRLTYQPERSAWGRSFQFSILCICGLFALAACQPDATPVANVAPPTPTEDIAATLPPPIRYVLGASAQNLGSISAEIAQSALLIPASGLTEESQLGADYDVIADYGVIDGWELSPVIPTVSLIINPNLAPLNDDNIANIIRSGIDGVRIVNQTSISGTRPLAASTIRLTSLKTEFANLGFPDGFTLRVGLVDIPNSQAIIDEFDQLNIDTKIINGSLEETALQLANNRIHLAVVKWHSVSEKSSWTAAVSDNNVIDLYQLAISYLASPDLIITFADNGFPSASH